MDTKNRNEVVHFRWWLLVDVFFICISFVMPIVSLIIYDELGIFTGIIVAIPIAICIALQSNWSLKAKCISTLLVTVSFSFLKYLYMIPIIPIVFGILIYRFLLLVCHQLYNEVELEDGTMGYKEVSIRKEMMLFAAYFGITLNVIIFSAGVAIIIATPGSSSSALEDHRKLVSSIPTFPLFVSPFLAIPAQIMACLQKGWTRSTKIRNIVIIEIIFIAVGMIVMLLFYLASKPGFSRLFPLALLITPFVLWAGIALLRHIFIKSSLDALERKE